jgi:nucleoside-diphosphate kinase
MSQERTLSIIKPDAVKAGHMGAIMKHIEGHGLRIVAAQLMHLSLETAKEFYAVHNGRPFFDELTQFISSGPVMVMTLEGPNAIAKNREIMGATNPAEAAEGTIRKLYAKSIGENAVHGSDSEVTARQEIDFFFTKKEFVTR